MEETELRQRITEPSESSIEDVIPVHSKTSSITKHHEGFHTLCVMEFAVGTPASTTEWLLSKIQASQNDGGGELQAELVQDDTGKVHIQSDS